MTRLNCVADRRRPTPQFILDRGSSQNARRFQALDQFTQGYIEAAFFTSSGTGDDGDLEDASFGELAPDALAAIVADCAAWQAANVALLDLAYARDGYDATRAGHDYWYTRNGHGVGFWDRTELDGEGLGDRLSDACRYSEKNLYRGDDGLIYLD